MLSSGGLLALGSDRQVLWAEGSPGRPWVPVRGARKDAGGASAGAVWTRGVTPPCPCPWHAPRPVRLCGTRGGEHPGSVWEAALPRLALGLRTGLPQGSCDRAGGTLAFSLGGRSCQTLGSEPNAGYQLALGAQRPVPSKLLWRSPPPRVSDRLFPGPNRLTPWSSLPFVWVFRTLSSAEGLWLPFPVSPGLVNPAGL